MRKFTDRTFLALLLAVLIAVPVGVAAWSRRETSAYYENRALATRPDLSWETLWDGSYGSRFETWYSDHAPLRTTLLKTNAAVQMKLLKRPVVSDVVVTGDVLLPKMSFSEWTRKDYENNARPIAGNFGKLNDHVKANGGSFYFVGFPEQRVYFEDKFPDYMNNHETEAAVADEVFESALTMEGVRFLNMEAAFDADGRPEEYYSTVDHHYNYYGAYASYRAIVEALAADGWELPVLTEEDIEFRELPNPYLGSRNRKLYNLWENGEKAAILYTALMFGLMHGNVTQFLYATVIGILLGYMAVKTGRMLYNTLLHILVNSLSMLLSVILMAGGPLSILISLGSIFLMFAEVTAALILLAVFWKETRLLPGNWPEGVTYRDVSSALYRNAGTIVFVLVSLAMMGYYLFLA